MIESAKRLFSTHLALLFLIVSLVACAGSVSPRRHIAYSGPQRGVHEVAILSNTSANFKPVIGSAAILILSIDGSKKGFAGSAIDKSVEVEVLPGDHTVEVMYYTPRTYSIANKTIKFNASAGHRYFIDPNVSHQSKTWNPIIRDVTATH